MCVCVGGGGMSVRVCQPVSLRMLHYMPGCLPWAFQLSTMLGVSRTANRTGNLHSRD